MSGQSVILAAIIIFLLTLLARAGMAKGTGGSRQRSKGFRNMIRSQRTIRARVRRNFQY